MHDRDLAGLRRVVCQATGLRLKGVGGGRDHDRPPSAGADHRPPSLLNEVPGASHVDIQDLVPALICELKEGHEICDTGDLDRRVKVTEPLDRELDPFPNVSTPADVSH